ncbi:uncharacterized protein BP5553_02522 [Venustampulla echinocandica]|uniref:Secreted protein n=1 Tax=Venustampulla echinocandica TaxID=2656787 RepID=A0A370U473_9HELO|nr:uncharacterized protein BP5553_02522 [Venustampulla echinocandica]RDL42543.1 hypothetical protein BP5553_02522 [Venustampulla echinocandica]
MGLFSTRSFALFLGITLATAAPAPAAIAAQVLSGAPAAANARVADFGYSGSGCPQGSAESGFDTAINADRGYFHDLTAFMTPNASQADRSNNCQMHISVTCDPGWEFTLKPHSTKLTAHVNLGDGATAVYLTSYYFSEAATQTATVRYSFDGPLNDCPTIADPAPNIDYPRSGGGGGLLVVNRRVALTGDSRSAVGSIQLWGDADDGNGKNANFVPWRAFEWSRC